MMILLCLDQADTLNLKDETISTLIKIYVGLNKWVQGFIGLFIHSSGEQNGNSNITTPPHIHEAESIGQCGLKIQSYLLYMKTIGVAFTEGVKSLYFFTAQMLTLIDT